jgi:hypothetical protein
MSALAWGFPVRGAGLATARPALALHVQVVGRSPFA